MKPGEINLKICEWLGWTILEPEVHPAITYNWSYPPGVISGDRSILPSHVTGPEALGNLHEVEKRLTEEQREKYVRMLVFLQKKGDLPIFMSAALQRATALVKVIAPEEGK